MKKGLYRRLAWTGIRKNKRLYVPYILTCIGMVMMFYIFAFLSSDRVMETMPGKAMLGSIMNMGCIVLIIFAAIFLFYTNSFLTRGRKKEFGLYNILGMGKKNLAKVLLWENLIVAGLAFTIGIVMGILFSKLAELGIINLTQGEITFSLQIDVSCIFFTLRVFAVIFFLIFLNVLRQIQLSKPIELLRSEHAGEKPPKANWVLAFLGAVILGTAYYIAVSIQDPVVALVWFFIAVIMVILGTYLLFISGSVAICRLLQKRKRYYYQSNHFVSLSSMIYRMKRNGAGLASICILCTMVLVMISSSMCLYIGKEDSLKAQYLRGMNLSAQIPDMTMMRAERLENVRHMVQEAVEEKKQSMENVLDYRCALMDARIEDGKILTDDVGLYEFEADSYANVWQVFVVPLEDYNEVMHQNETLEQGEVLLYTSRRDYTEDTVAFGASAPLKVKKTVPEFVEAAYGVEQVIPSMYVFVPDFEQQIAPMLSLADFVGNQMVRLKWYYGFDVQDQKAQMELGELLLKKLEENGAFEMHISLENRAEEQDDFYALYGGLFFLGILLGTVFICAAVLIIYYKQISEGYEDQARFGIMQKVGMTKKEIRKSINSQVLTVFFLPLIAAGVHLMFAFPIIYKLLMLFSLMNKVLLIGVTAGSFVVFGLFYGVVYHITSKAYYGIVSGAKE